MLPRHQNELLTRIGPETPMGKTMRLYWIPACLSHELAEPGEVNPPRRVRSTVRSAAAGDVAVALMVRDPILKPAARSTSEPCARRGARSVKTSPFRAEIGYSRARVLH